MEPIKTDKPGFVKELIYDMLQITNKKFYTAYEIKKYLIEKNNRDPGNLITRDLLVSLCKRMYEEEGLLFYVEGEGNSLILYRAENKAMWIRHSLGEIYVPDVIVNDTKLDFNDFKLYVYDSISGLKCNNGSKHKIECVTIRTKNIYDVLVSFNGFFCTECHKFFATIDEIKSHFPNGNFPFMHMSYSGSGEFRRNESELMIYGYSVRADGPTDYVRQNLLTYLMTYNIVPKDRIIAIIRDHINYNGRKDNMGAAVLKWKADLAYVQSFGLSKQRQVNVKKVDLRYKGKKY